MTTARRIEGTYRSAWPGTTAHGPIDPDAHVRMTVWFAGTCDPVREAQSAARIGALPLRARAYESRAGYRARTTQTGDDIALLEAYCDAHALRVAGRHWRSAVIEGRLGNLVDAFGATVDIRADPRAGLFRHRRGWLSAPQHLSARLRGAFGLSEWPRSPRIGTPSRDRVPLTAAEIQRHYSFPARDGKGQTIAILAYAGSYRQDDFDRAMTVQGIARGRPVIKHVDRERAAHHVMTTADVECATDVQIAAALAPGARIVVYETMHDERGLLDAIRTVIFDEQELPSILSISYGFVERVWTHSALALLDELFVAAASVGISVFVASGDNGAELDERGAPHVLAPASSRFVLACGATRLHDKDARTESAWHHSGGGFGRPEAPSWQGVAREWAERNGHAPRRGVPDVAAQCDPGYIVVIDGQTLAMHGTSTIAPMWSALAARINERAVIERGKRATIGFFSPLLYANAAGVMRPVTSGSNGYFEASGTWNPCAGLGVPNGRALEALLLG